MAAKWFNSANEGFLNMNIFAQDESNPAELQALDSYHRKGYVVTVTKLKTKFRNIRSLLMKGYANWKLSGHGNEDDEIDGKDNNEDRHLCVCVQLYWLLSWCHSPILHKLCVYKVWSATVNSSRNAIRCTAQWINTITHIHCGPSGWSGSDAM